MKDIIESCAKNFAVGVVLGLAIVGITAILTGFDLIKGCKR